MRMIKVELVSGKTNHLNSDLIESFSQSGDHTDIRFNGMNLSVREPVEKLKEQIEAPHAVEVASPWFSELPVKGAAWRWVKRHTQRLLP